MIHLTETFNINDVVWIKIPSLGKRRATIGSIRKGSLTGHLDITVRLHEYFEGHVTQGNIPCHTDDLERLTDDEYDRFKTEIRRKLKIRIIKKRLSSSEEGNNGLIR